jgi:hypothetical protein
MMGGMAEIEALLSCGDVVTEVDPPTEHDRVHWTVCPKCQGARRVVKVILPAGALIATGGQARRRAEEIGEIPYFRAVDWVAARPDGTVEFGYSGKRDPYVLPAIAEVAS